MTIDTAKIRAAAEAAKKAGWPDEGLALVAELCNELVAELCNEIERLRHENGTPLSMLGVDQLRQENDDLRQEIERLRKELESEKELRRIGDFVAQIEIRRLNGIIDVLNAIEAE